MKLGDKIYRDPNSKDFVKELVTDDTHLARIYGVIDQGLIENKQYKKIANRVLILFEIVDDLMAQGDYVGKPKVMNKSYTVGSTDRSGLRIELLKAVEGRLLDEKEAKNYPLEQLLGKPLKIDVLHQKSEKDPTVVYANISGLSRVSKSESVPELVHETIFLDLDKFNVEEFKKIPKWIRNKMINLDGVKNIDKILAELEAEEEDKKGSKSDAIERAKNV